VHPAPRDRRAPGALTHAAGAACAVSVSVGDDGHMAVAQRPALFTPKPTDTLVAEAEERGQSLKRVVGVLDLSALGLGAIIGTGIFVILGEAIGDAGPAIVVSFTSPA
jgi:amino acid permease